MNIKSRPASYEVYDITGEEKILLANQVSITKINPEIVSSYGSVYSEVLELKNFKNETKILELDIYSDDEELLISFKINLDEKEIDVLNRKNVVFEKISEVELKEILSKYVALNFYNDTDSIQYVDGTKEEAENSVLVELAMDLIYDKMFESNGNYTLENSGDINAVNAAIHEITGENYTGVIDIIDEHYFYYNKDTNSYEFKPGDGFVVPGFCLDISDISYKNGIYTVTCVYCFPDMGNYEEGSIGTLEQYKSTFELKINEDPVFAKYRIVNFNNLTSEKVKEADKVEPDHGDKNLSTNTVTKPSTNTISNTVTNTTTVINPSDEKINEANYFSFLEDVVCVNFFNDLNSTTEYHTKEEYENEMKLISAFEIVGGDFMTYEQQHQVFKELYNIDQKNVTGANIVVKNTGTGYKYISKQYQAFASVLDVVDKKEENGIYTVNVIYTYSNKNTTIYDDCPKYSVTFRYKINSNYNYSKYQVVDINEVIRENTSTEETIPEPEIVDNLASSLEWETVYSIGLETVKPSTWEVITFDDLYDGSDKEQHGEVSTCILGEAKGIDKNTNEIITSNVQINYFTPMYLGKMSQVDAEDYIEELLDIKSEGSGSYIFETDMSWNLYKKVGHDNQIYCSYDQMSDGSIWVYVIDFDTDNWDNLKVVNIMNRILGRTKGCSF